MLKLIFLAFVADNPCRLCLYGSIHNSCHLILVACTNNKNFLIYSILCISASPVTSSDLLQAKKQLKNHKNYQELLYKPYYRRKFEGDRSEGSKAYLTCLNDWKLMKGTPAVQECVRENGELVWTKPGTCVYSKFS